MQTQESSRSRVYESFSGQMNSKQKDKMACVLQMRCLDAVKSLTDRAARDLASLNQTDTVTKKESSEFSSSSLQNAEEYLLRLS